MSKAEQPKQATKPEPKKLDPNLTCLACGAPMIRPNYCWPCRAKELAQQDGK